MHFVDLGESFPTEIYLQNLASIQPRTSPVKFARTYGVRLEAEKESRARGPPLLAAGGFRLREAEKARPEVRIVPSQR